MTTPQAAQAAPVAEEKLACTYLKFRFKDGATKEGRPYKVTNILFYNGTQDKNGNPMFSNRDEKVSALVNKHTGGLDWFKTDDNGKSLKDAEGKYLPSFISTKLDGFVDGNEGAAPLEVGGREANGPGASDLLAKFKAVIEAKPAKPATASKATTPGM